MLNGYSRLAFIKGKKWSFKSWKGSFIWVRWSTCAQNQKRALPLTRPFLFLSGVWSGHRHRPFHSNISFSSPALFPVKVMLWIKEMTIFSISLETLDKSPRALAKIRAGYSSCHSAPVVPHSKYTNLFLLTLIIHKQHKGWNRAGWSLFMSPKCFIPLKMCPELFSLARKRVAVSLSALSSSTLWIFTIAASA